MYTLLKQEGAARRGEFATVHGTVRFPAFMNVATCGAIKGALSAYDLKNIHTQIMLSNTYHLHLRPGDRIVRQLGGLHKMTGWGGVILTDSGGFQVFSLAKLREKKASGSTRISTADGFSWAPRKACRSSPIWAPPSRWRSMNASRIRPNTATPKTPSSAPPTGSNAVSQK